MLLIKKIAKLASGNEAKLFHIDTDKLREKGLDLLSYYFDRKKQLILPDISLCLIFILPTKASK